MIKGGFLEGGGVNPRQQFLGWKCLHIGTRAPPGKFLKIDAKILQLRDISTY